MLINTIIKYIFVISLWQITLKLKLSIRSENAMKCIY